VAAESTLSKLRVRLDDARTELAAASVLRAKLEAAVEATRRQIAAKALATGREAVELSELDSTLDVASSSGARGGREAGRGLLQEDGWLVAL
jgi:hypothetical protein